jgi:hypothetical protein
VKEVSGVSQRAPLGLWFVGGRPARPLETLVKAGNAEVSAYLVRKLRQVENGGRDSTDDWRLPARSLPPTIAELEARIDEALVIARSSEAAVISVGAAAIESAEQAKRAADLAVKASEAASRGAALGAPNGSAGNGPARPDPHEDDRLVRFSHRADRLGARFAQLQRR